MAHPVLALGAALVTASGCVWYLPALATVRAGADRPDSVRGAAAACLSGWTTAAGVAVLLLVADPWWPPAALAAAGAALTAALRIRAALRRRHEVSQTAFDWAGSRPGPTHRVRMYRARNRFATVLGLGLGTAAASAVLLAAARPGHPGEGAAVAVPVLLTALFLAAAIGRARAARRSAGSRPGR